MTIKADRFDNLVRESEKLPGPTMEDQAEWLIERLQEYTAELRLAAKSKQQMKDDMMDIGELQGDSQEN